MPTVKNVGEPCAGKSHARFDAAAGGNQTSRLRRAAQAPPADPYLDNRVWVSWRGHRVADYERCYRPGTWLPEPRMRPEPPPPAVVTIRSVPIDAPELADYAELCA